MFPQKRHVSLQPLSREHHQALLLCWKLRQGFNKGVEPERMMKYAGWFWNQYLAPHFNAEETVFFPILPKDHPAVIKALKQHKDLKAMFNSTDADMAYTLRQIAFELEQHIRFEERDLFNEIQTAASPEQLEELKRLHKEEKFNENIEDMFWVEVREKKKAPDEKEESEKKSGERPPVKNKPVNKNRMVNTGKPRTSPGMKKNTGNAATRTPIKLVKKKK